MHAKTLGRVVQFEDVEVGHIFLACPSGQHSSFGLKIGMANDEDVVTATAWVDLQACLENPVPGIFTGGIYANDSVLDMNDHVSIVPSYDHNFCAPHGNFIRRPGRCYLRGNRLYLAVDSNRNGLRDSSLIDLETGLSARVHDNQPEYEFRKWTLTAPERTAEELFSFESPDDGRR